MDADKLIGAMARAVHEHLCRRDIMQYLDNPEDCEGLAAISYTAMRDALVPVGWMYQSDIPSVQYRVVRANRREVVHRGWTETPLYALPEIKP